MSYNFLNQQPINKEINKILNNHKYLKIVDLKNIIKNTTNKKFLIIIESNNFNTMYIGEIVLHSIKHIETLTHKNKIKLSDYIILNNCITADYEYFENKKIIKDSYFLLNKKINLAFNESFKVYEINSK